jgi:hypothetical protein
MLRSYLYFSTLFLLTLCHAISVIAQNTVPTTEIPTNINGQAEFVDMAFVDSISKEVLHQRAMQWLKDTYGNPKKADKVQNSREIILIAKAKTEQYRYHFKGKDMKVGQFSYIFSIHCQEGKYKCIVNEIQYQSNAIAELIGADLAAEQPFKDQKYVEDGFLQIWYFLRKSVQKDILKDLQTLKLYMLDEMPK